MKTQIKNYLFCLFVLLIVLDGRAQIVKDPIYARKDCNSIQILEVQILPDKTIIKGEYTNIESNGWANITNTTFIRDCSTNQKYKIISSTGLPLSPKKHTLSRKDETVSFEMIFPAVKRTIKKIDLIEDENSCDGFNVYEIGLDKNLDREFIIKETSGQKFTNKPSFRNRICGVKEILILMPKAPKDLDKFIFGSFQMYLNLLGIKTETITANYEDQILKMGTVSAFNRHINDNVGNYTTEANKLCAAISYISYYGNYVGGTEITIIFVDPVNGYTWEFKMKLPNKADKFVKELQKVVCNSYTFDPQYSVILPSRRSNYNAVILKEDIAKNGCDLIEGIYRGDKYTVGLKRHKDTYYLIYFDGADNSNWKEGDIKASLTGTATPSLYKAIWFGAWKQKLDMTVIFSEGFMSVIDENKEEEIYIKTYPTYDMLPKQEQSSKWSGTGFFLSPNDYVVTNHHVVDEAKELKITGINGDYKTNYSARVEVIDEHNDLAIIKITDSNFKPFSSLPYAIRKNNANIGEDCFVLGYPLISTMGMDIKLTNGIISAKTGYQGDVSQYQISAPIQPGNSGGPLFDRSGNLIGVVCAKHTEAENAGYAIKVNYLSNLADALHESIVLPHSNRLMGKTLPEQVKIASNYVCVILAE